MHLFAIRDETPGMLSLAAALFGTVEIAGTFIGPERAPMTTAFIRFFLTVIVLPAFSIPLIRRRLAPLGIRDYGLFFLSGFPGITAAVTLFHAATGFISGRPAASRRNQRLPLTGTALILPGLVFALTRPDRWPLTTTVKGLCFRIGGSEPSLRISY